MASQRDARPGARRGPRAGSPSSPSACAGGAAAGARGRPSAGGNPRRSLGGASSSSSLSLGAAAAAASEAAVRVAVRVRPRLPAEVAEPDGVEVLPDGQTLALSSGRDRRQFTVDQVFDSRQDECTQATLFDAFGRGLVNSSLQGYNVCIFAHGHTGSGKTFTMLGDGSSRVPKVRGENAGFLPRFLHEVFAAREQDPRGKDWRCSCEYYEVYNEQIQDLSSPGDADKRVCRVHVHPKYGVRIDGLGSSVVTCVEDALALVAFGNQMRSVAATTMNERSSRSHAFFTLKYELPASGDQPAMATAQRTATFVDLAGREDRAASGQKALLFREMCCINTSLFHLAHLIHKIAEGQLDRNSLADFRNSKLTTALAQALTGNSRTALIATLSPLQSCFDDSVSTMSFATSVKKIQTRPFVNKSGKAVVADLEAEVRKLQRELADHKLRNSDKEQELMAAQAMIGHFKRSWEEAVVESEQLKHRRRKSMAMMGLAVEPKLPRLPCGLVAPFLTKLCDDPALQGACNYFLDRPVLRFGNNPSSNDVVLHGLGILDEMCEVRHSDDGSFPAYVALSNTHGDTIARVIVNGRPLTHACPSRTIEHGGSIILGYAHAFRLVVPSWEGVAAWGIEDATAIAQDTLSSLDVASAVEEIGVEGDGRCLPSEHGAAEDAFAYMSHLKKRLPENSMQSLTRAINVLQPLIDEANLLTREVLGHSDLRLELHSLAHVFGSMSDEPSFAVCVLENPRPLRKLQHGVLKVQQLLRGPAAAAAAAAAAAPGGGGGARRARRSIRDIVGDRTSSYVKGKTPRVHALGLEHCMLLNADQEILLHVWSLEEFLRRLSEFRDTYSEAYGADGGLAALRERFAAQPYSNPWEPATFAETRALGDLAAMFAERRGASAVCWPPTEKVADSPSSKLSSASRASDSVKRQNSEALLPIASREAPGPEQPRGSRPVAAPAPPTSLSFTFPREAEERSDGPSNAESGAKPQATGLEAGNSPEAARAGGGGIADLQASLQALKASVGEVGCALSGVARSVEGLAASGVDCEPFQLFEQGAMQLQGALESQASALLKLCESMATPGAAVPSQAPRRPQAVQADEQLPRTAMSCSPSRPRAERGYGASRDDGSPGGFSQLAKKEGPLAWCEEAIKDLLGAFKSHQGKVEALRPPSALLRPSVDPQPVPLASAEQPLDVGSTESESPLVAPRCKPVGTPSSSLSAARCKPAGERALAGACELFAADLARHARQLQPRAGEALPEGVGGQLCSRLPVLGNGLRALAEASSRADLAAAEVLLAVSGEVARVLCHAEPAPAAVAAGEELQEPLQEPLPADVQSATGAGGSTTGTEVSVTPLNSVPHGSSVTHHVHGEPVCHPSHARAGSPPPPVFASYVSAWSMPLTAWRFQPCTHVVVPASPGSPRSSARSPSRSPSPFCRRQHAAHAAAAVALTPCLAVPAAPRMVRSFSAQCMTPVDSRSLTPVRAPPHCERRASPGASLQVAPGSPSAGVGRKQPAARPRLAAAASTPVLPRWDAAAVPVEPAAQALPGWSAPRGHQAQLAQRPPAWEYHESPPPSRNASHTNFR